LLMIREVPVRCPICGEISEVSVDPSAGAVQEYAEDCSVCCRPWKVRVVLDEWGDPDVTVFSENP